MFQCELGRTKEVETAIPASFDLPNSSLVLPIFTFFFFKLFFYVAIKTNSKAIIINKLKVKWSHRRGGRLAPPSESLLLPG